jgi:4-hydroxy-tetrahydrodipicolinate reductase
MLIDSIRQSLDQRLDTVHGRHSKNQRRTKHEIGVHALRGGGIVGQHDVVFAGQGEVIEISHSALSRDVFGHGAIRAAEFVVSCRPGFYTMKHVIEAARTRS